MRIEFEFATNNVTIDHPSIADPHLPSPPATATGDFMPSAEALNAIRSWISVGQATVPTLADDLTAAIPEDFVKQRQADSRVSRFPRFSRPRF
jgi:hypothetical protein